MKIFLIGSSRCGKTPIAKEICKNYNYIHIEASELFRKKYKKPDLIEDLLEFSANCYKDLRQNINYNLDYIKNKIEENKNYIITGIRNPIDFDGLYELNKDIVIFLKREDLKEEPDNNISFFSNGLLFINNRIKLHEMFNSIKIRYDFIFKDRNDISLFLENIKNNEIIKEIIGSEN